MEVIKNNYTKYFLMQCMNCDSILKITDKERMELKRNDKVILCPCCENALDSKNISIFAETV